MNTEAALAQVRWPDGYRFAFSIFDDTDRSTLDNAPPIYALLRDLGMRTTKSVWPLPGTRAPSVVGGSTCGDPAYLAWVQQLQREGFEIGLHNVTFHSSTREEVRTGLERFAEFFGHPPRSLATHTDCRDGMYWGNARVSNSHRLLYDVLTRFRQRDFGGHVDGGPHFWGDLCQAQVDYVRNFTFPGLNTLKSCPWMPYFDPDRPWANAWFASSEGADCTRFNNALSEAAQDELVEEGGACIMYTHFGKGFCTDGAINRRFVELMTRLSARGGWFVPVSSLLDHIAATRGGVHPLARHERGRLERRWLAHKLAHGTS
ncbi:hypothetical protein [Novilysobacter antarcticus]|uniref:hypothetical protein n=1 Tax=Novilysobacter antarcticus TaxID=2862543 RepID=UPI001C99293E|nr:hypothetical protein [Lysobacter antarcticus]